MTPRKTISHLKAGLATALFSATILTPISALAQVAVNDSQNISEAASQRQLSANQLSELTQIRNLEQEQLSALGDFGPLGDLFGGQAFSSVGSQSDFYTNMEAFAFDPCAVNLCQGGDNVVGTTDIDEAREWAEKNFFAVDLLSYEQERDLREVRRRGQVYAAVKGLGLATITSNELAGAGDQATALEEIVDSSNNLRGDVRANSAIALAAYKIELQQLAMLTSLLEVSAMDSVAVADVYHETGGTSFPDAFKEDDFAENDQSQRVRVTHPQQGSSGGSGFGGGLLGSMTDSGSFSGLLSGLGSDSGLSSVLGSGQNGLDGLIASIGSGALPTMNADDLSMASVVADSASLAQSSLPDNASNSIKSGLAMVKNGMAQGTTTGRTSALMGVSQALSDASGNSSLAKALNTGAQAISNSDSGMAINFANGALRDLAENGVVGETADYLRNQISLVENGTLDSDILVLDASTILANQGSDANSSVAQILSIDPAQLSDSYMQGALATTIDTIASSTGASDLSEISTALRGVTEDDISNTRGVFQSVSDSSNSGQPASSASQTGNSRNVFE